MNLQVHLVQQKTQTPTSRRVNPGGPRPPGLTRRLIHGFSSINTLVQRDLVVFQFFGAILLKADDNASARKLRLELCSPHFPQQTP
jgi:hypothetical protein